MGSRLRKLTFLVIAACLLSDSAYAVTKSPTPVVTKKTSAAPTAIAKTTAKPTAKTTAKTTATKKAVATKKPVVKRTYKPRPKVSVTPSPSPIWPPKGYLQNGDIYAKIPTSKELIGWTSSNSRLSKELKQCESVTCGALLAASVAGCNWWEFNADVVGPTSDTDSTEIKYGSVATLYGSTKPKQIVPFVLISQEPVKVGVKLSGIKVLCHREPVPTDLKVPSNTYIKNN